MNSFVTTCKKEWDRLGVPTGIANEMAADLEADLNDAETDGASPEEVLGISFFDPKSFAASWARERGVVRIRPHSFRQSLRQHWVLAMISLASFGISCFGIAVLFAPRAEAVARIALARPNFPNVRHIFDNPQQVFSVHQFGPIPLIGIGLIIIGLVGFGITLWIWKPWTVRSNKSISDDNISMPNFL